MLPTANDGYAGNYSYLSIDTSPDSVTGPGKPLAHSRGLTPCPRKSAIQIRFKTFRGRPITRAVVFVDNRRLLVRHGKRLRSVSLPGLPGSGRHLITVEEYTRKGLARSVTLTVKGCIAG
jgi:hypothetical protein